MYGHPWVGTVRIRGRDVDTGGSHLTTSRSIRADLANGGLAGTIHTGARLCHTAMPGGTGNNADCSVEPAVDPASV